MEGKIANLAAWMPLRQSRQPGLRRQFTLINSVVQTAALTPPRQSKSGSTVDRLFSQKTTVAASRNFITVPVAQFGGHGAPIARPTI
jgi:hypothetical protein